MSSLALIALTLPPLLLPYPVSAALVNQTIDDEYGDSITGTLPVYGPDESYWHEGSSCSVCHITPLVDTTQPFDRTWHDGTYNPGGPDITITFSFTGSAVYVYNIVPNTVEFTVTFVNITFTLDGSPVGMYVHDPDPTSVLLYRQVVYKNTSLDNREHTMEMHSSGTNASLILFDYVIYTAEQASSSSGTSSSSTSSASSSATSALSSSSSSHSTPVGAIAGGIVGGIVFLAFLAIVGFFIQRRRNPKEPRPLSGPLEIKPFMDGAGGGPYAPGVPYQDSESGGSVSAGGGSGYGGGASRNNAVPLLPANSDSSKSSRRQASVKRKMVPLSTQIQSPSSPGTPGSTPTRQHTSASAPASQHQVELTDRIRVLEDRMRGLAADSTAASDRSWRATRPASNGTGTDTGDEAVRTLQGELAALRSEVAGLNAQLAEGRMRGGGESLPPYLESPHTSRPQS